MNVDRARRSLHDRSYRHVSPAAASIRTSIDRERRRVFVEQTSRPSEDARWPRSSIVPDSQPRWARRPTFPPTLGQNMAVDSRYLAREIDRLQGRCNGEELSI